MDIEPYNPLHRLNLARSIETTLMQQPIHRLPLAELFPGAGLYALYYLGDFADYKPISSSELRVPIYVGKAEHKGSRKGLIDPSALKGSPLYGRIADHVASLTWAKNLELDDFRVRYLVVDDTFIGLGEALLITQFKPIWNMRVSGFGLHEPGKRRHGGNRSEWDELHPGRPWRGKMKKNKTAAEIRKAVKAAFDSGEAATVENPSLDAPPVAHVAVPVPRQPEDQP